MSTTITSEAMVALAWENGVPIEMCDSDNRAYLTVWGREYVAVLDAEVTS